MAGIRRERCVKCKKMFGHYGTVHIAMRRKCRRKR